ncbi:MAG: hypothetical protein ACLFUB_17640 [Cyclobacteriaceae bacterium]
MNLQDELIRADRRRQKSYESEFSLAEIKDMLKKEERKEQEMLQKLGLSGNAVMDRRYNWLQQQKLSEQYQGEVYHKDDIKNICMQYNMRMLPVSLYRGPVDHMFAPKLKNFQRKHRLSDEEVEENFFIVAPPEAFELEKRDRPVIDLDPLLVYRVDGHFFRLVHQWGSDLNVFRYVASWKRRDLWNMTLHWFIMTFMVTMLLLGFFVDHFGNAVTLSLLISGLIGWMYYSSFRDNPDEMRHRFSRYNWDQTWTY